MRNALLLLPILLGTVATPAAAQIVGRAEVRAGYDEPRLNVRVFDYERETLGDGDLAFGGEVGVDAYVTPNILVGAYAGLDFSQADTCDNDFIFTGDVACLEAGRNFTAGVRGGLTTGETGLIYVKGGYSNGKFKASYDDDDGFIVDESESLNGWHLGLGFEVGVARNLYVKGEYTHHWYDRMYRSEDDDADFDVHRHMLMAGVGIRFGGPAVVAPPVEPVYAPPPPVEAPPATQTCADGSVILATDSCPPPPPPPPPPSPGERG